MLFHENTGENDADYEWLAIVEARIDMLYGEILWRSSFSFHFFSEKTVEIIRKFSKGKKEARGYFKSLSSTERCIHGSMRRGDVLGQKKS